jgi:SanA protein
MRSGVAPAAAIVVLGASLRADGGLTRALDERVRVGVDLWRRQLAPVVIMTGGGSGVRVEADAMAARAAELGVPMAALRCEREARNTAENAFNVAADLEPGTRVWVVTQPFHLRRSMYHFRRAGLTPLAWHNDASIQFERPASLRWIAREYLAWLLVPVRNLRQG